MIQIKQLTKRFGEIHALRGVDLEVGQGELFGLLGPNGAGKTTLINILCTYLRADEGEITIDGLRPGRDDLALRHKIGVVPQEIALYDDLTARENLMFWGRLHGMGGSKLKQRTSRLLEITGLQDRGDDQLKKYSGGMKRRINIAAGIMHEPGIIFFDEPTVGVDPQSRVFIFEMIEELHRQGATIIYTTHYMEEAERLCTRIGIIDNGKIIARGTREELYRLLDGEGQILLQYLGERRDFTIPQSLSLVSESLEDRQIILQGDNPTQSLQPLLESLGKSGITLESIQFSKPNLEQVFLHLTGRELRQ